MSPEKKTQCRRRDENNNQQSPMMMSRRSMLTLSFKRTKGFLVSEAGPTAVEYAVMLALIVGVCLQAVTRLGKRSRRTYRKVKKALKKANK